MSLETRTESLKALPDLYEKIINDHKSLMQFGCVKEFIKNNMEIMDELE